MTRMFTLFVGLAVAGIAIAGSPDEKTPVELGAVKWNRDLPAAKAASAKSGKPMMLFFQEVPG